MAVEITVPTLGESIVEATVGRWLKHEGEPVEQGETVVELETDKVNMEVPASVSGILRQILKPEGETVGTGEVLALVAAAEDVDTAAPATITAAPVVAAQATATPATPTAPTALTAASSDDGAAARATPVARRIAEEHHLDLGRVAGTGTAGRITQEDIVAYLQQQAPISAPAARPLAVPATANGASPSAPPPASPPASPPATDLYPAPLAPAASLAAAPADVRDGRREERVRLSRRRQTIARRLVEAQHTAAMLTTFNEVDMSAIMALRARRRDAFKERHGVGLGYMSFFTKAVIGGLKAYPRLNAEIAGDDMILKRYYDIGVAVSTDEGLVVPVLRDADRLSFAAIEQGIAELAQKARNRTLSLAELQGGTFTITNGGIFGSMLSTPILNAPQVGILGMHKIEERPIALNGQVVIHPMMYLAVSYDHRIVDGAEAVSFLVRVKELLEDPESLLLEG
ncbi:MAG: 2-oxoglutarate dehydrogenase complex dihydrolipoyllysine-residue succinyltransferase [Ktedonobacterales bacterium]